MNVQCALSYVFMPESFVSGFQLSGVPGVVAVQGIGIAFLMWNVTYPAFITNPKRFTVLGVVILVQQVIGLVGESALLACLPADLLYASLAQSILRFIQFDAFGLAIMLASFVFLLYASKTSGPGK